MTQWPKTLEDEVLKALCEERPGQLFTEVALADDSWTSTRYLDGVIIRGPKSEGRLKNRDFKNCLEDLRGATADIVEAKRGLGERLIGQALVGRWMFEKKLAVPHGLTIGETVVAVRHEDPCMRWVAARLGLSVFRQEPKKGKNDCRADRLEPKPSPAWCERVEQYEKSKNAHLIKDVPLDGDHWPPGSKPGVIPFVRVLSEVAPACERERLLRDPGQKLELLVATGRRPGRGALGIAAAQALLFERRYAREFQRCRILCEETDPAVEAAAKAVAAEHRLPPIEVFETKSLFS